MMKYEYENQDEPRHLATEIEVARMKITKAFEDQDRKLLHQGLTELETTQRRINNYRPIIKINVED